MAVESYGINNPLTNKIWARGLSIETRKGLEIAPLIGTGKNSIIQEKTEFKGRGDRVRFGLRMQLSGAGVSENATLEGNEEDLTLYYDDLLINELAHAVRVEGEDSIDQQRVLHNMRTEAKDGLKDWFGERMSLSVFLQLSGYTAPKITWRGRETPLGLTYTGLNGVLAPSPGRHFFAGSANTTDQAVGADTDAILTLDDVVKMKERAMLANPKIRPVRVNGADKYVMYLHPIHQTQLMLSAQASGTISWADIQLAAMKGGEVTKNPIYTGAVGEYMNVVFRVNEDVTTGVHATNGTEVPTVRRALMLGAQSGCIGFSSKFSKSSPYKWVEKKFDYDRELGVSAQGLMGMKKTRFDTEDFGCMVLSTYAAAA